MGCVMKRDGRLQEFSVPKILRSIARAAAEAGLPGDKSRWIVAEASGDPLTMAGGDSVVRTVDLRQKILGRLDEIAPGAAGAWREFDISRR